MWSGGAVFYADVQCGASYFAWIHRLDFKKPEERPGCKFGRDEDAFDGKTDRVP